MRRAPRSAVALVLASLALPAVARADLEPARTALARGDYATAEPQLRAARGSERAAADVLLGRLLMETGRYDEARQLGQRMARAAATRVEGLTLEGEALAATGQYDEAIARWQRAVARGRTGVGRRARALAGSWLARLGRRQEAEELAQPLIDEYNDAQQEAEDHPDAPGRLNPLTAVLRDAEALTYLGMAMRTLGFFQDANQAFNEALRADPRRVETLCEHAELYLSKEDMGHAGESLREALEANPRSARALVLKARTRLMNDLDFAHALEDLDAAARINPRVPEAFVIRAQIVLRDGDVPQADRLLDQALAINPRHLEALAMRGVVRFHANDTEGFHRAFDAVFAVSPVFVEAYALVADFADWDHRYEEAAVVMREGLQRPAVAADPRLQGQLRAQLGINLLRMGEEEEALRELQESFRRDRYNVRVYNLLNLYEDILARDYGTERAGPFVVRYHNDERRILSRYVPQLLQRAYDDMVRRYRFTPRGPLSIELFADTEHFSVRTSGLPEIGVQGVCFGRVITAISPRGGPFNWGQILWHELGHVFAIQMSRSRVPRWFTEGLSEWEAFHSHPEWAREDDATLYRAMNAGRVPRVADFNTAFTHARSGGDMLVAYYAASKLVEFMIDRYGFERVAQLLPLWGRGLSTQEVLQQGLGVSADELDRLFRAHTLQRLARFARQFAVDEGEYHEHDALVLAATQRPTDADAQARAAAAELFAGDHDAARQRATAALAINRAQPVAHWVLARLAVSGRDGAAALAEIDAILAAGHDGFELRALEAQAARAARNEARLRAALEAATRQDPTQPEPWELLAEIHRRGGRPAEALRALREVVRLDQHNREALRRLLAMLAAQNAWQDIRALTDHARMLDPEDVTTHVTLARAAAETNARDVAVFEYESALALEPRDSAPIHVALARLHLAANNRDRAQAAVRAALRIAPTNAEARALAQQLGVR
jgi:tetratricopeptide (TPR) repeat protein